MSKTSGAEVRAARRAIGSFAVLLVCASAARAQSLALGFDWSASAGSDVIMGGQQFGNGNPPPNPGQLYVQTGAASGVITNCNSTNYAAKAAYNIGMSVNYGQIQGFTDTQASLSGQAEDEYVCKNGTGSFGQAQSGFSDSFTITSASLPAGSPVKVKFTMSLNSTVSSKGVPANLYCGGLLSAAADLGFAYGSHYTLYHDNCSGKKSQTVSTILMTQVGAVPSIAQMMTLTAETDEQVDRTAYPWGPSGHTGINNPASVAVSGLAVDVLTPGAAYTSASGTVYPTHL